MAHSAVRMKCLEKSLLFLLIILSAVISPTSSAKLPSRRRPSRNGDDEAPGASTSTTADSSLETLLLRDKLNLILDAESREVTLLKNLLDESHQEEEEKKMKKKEHSSRAFLGALEDSVEKNELDAGAYKSERESLPTATSPPAPPTTTTTMMMASPTTEKVEHSLAYLREHGIVSKLEENSKRMEKMVVFLVDLRNLLTEALTAQAKQNAVETEIVEIREEMEYLRKELQTLKKGTVSASNSDPSISHNNNANLENKLHNDETTIEWLKESQTELRSQMREISESCNMTVIAQMKEQMDKDARRRDVDLAAAEKQLEILRLKQLRQDEQLSEARSNIEDVRSWQVKMGMKLIENKSTAAAAATATTTKIGSSTITIPDQIHNPDEQSQEEEEKSNSVEFGAEEHFITEAFKEAVGKPLRHGKRLKAKVHELQSIIQDLVKDNKNYHRRLVKIENSQRSLKSRTNNLRETLSQAGLISSGSSSSSISNDVYPSGSKTTSVNTNNVRLNKRMGSLEKTMQEYVITLENLNDKVGAVEELQESSTQLFRALETLETKYDERVTELQTGLARLESSVSSVLVVNEDLKEQQTQQSGLVQSVKKDLFQMKGKLQTNHLRLASIQSQMVKWASQKCSDESSESIQNIRIATLEHALLDAKRLASSTSSTELS